MEIYKVTPLPYECSQNYVYRTLRQNIVSLWLEPGAGISETELTAAFGLSRSPVRGALSRLREEGLVVIEPQRRTIVSKIDREYTIQASFTRNLIETELMCEIIEAGKETELCTRLMDILDSVEKNIGSSSYDDADKFYGLLSKDIQFHSAIYLVSNRNKLLECLRLPYLHYNRFQSLHLRSQIEENSFIPHHMKLVDIIKRRDIESLLLRKNDNIKHVKSVMERSVAAHPEFFI